MSRRRDYFNKIRSIIFYNAETGEELFRFDPLKSITLEEVEEMQIHEI